MNKGKLIVVSGPSGVGKDTVVSKYLEKHPEDELSISMTSRPIRPNEIDGVNYYFKTKEGFEEAIKNGDLLEYAEYNGNYYGTPKSEKIEDFLDYIWDNPVVQLSHGTHEKFIGPNRTRVTKVLKKVFTALTNYVHAKKILETTGSGNLSSAPTGKALEILSELQKQIARVEKRGNLGVYVFREFANNLAKKLKGEVINFSYKDCLLGANYIELANNFPVAENFGVPDFSLKDRFFAFESDLKDKTLRENLKRAHESALKNYDCGILQDLQKNFNLGVSDEDMRRKITAIERQVDKQIERIYSGFLNDLELARNYSRITDQEKIDAYINAIVAAKKHFTETKNAGIFRCPVKQQLTSRMTLTLLSFTF